MIDENKLSKKFDGGWGNGIKKIIVGTMPGKESNTEDGLYYLSNRNSFWKIMEDILKDPFVELIKDKEFDEVIKRLKGKCVALFDVLSACDRDGTSSDGKITNSEKNDGLESFLKNNTNVQIIFNGRKAEKLFKKLFKEFFNEAICHYVPSSSNANSKSNKTAEWQKYL